MIFLDITFLRALLNIHSADENICIVRKNGNLVVCRNLKNTYSDIIDVPKNEFTTGWQSYSGEKGTWATWNNVDEITEGSGKDEVAHTSKATVGDAWTSTLDRKQYIDLVDTMKNDMERGDYFLANLTRITECEKKIDPIYVAIVSCLKHATPFRFYAQLDGYCFLGLSPERFVRIKGDSIICEPMKGTAKSSESLQNNKKEFVENTMIIDLVRSDLSRICIPESVKLIRRDHITQHPGLFQMDSTISGRLFQDLLMADAIKTLMPVSSVTGTPKPYVLKIIDKYEPHARGNYCGVYGWVDNRINECDLAVGIRIIEMDQNQARIGVGSGITIESDSASEFEETGLKASRLCALVDLASTEHVGEVFTSLAIDISYTPFLLDSHCERLARHGKSNKIDLTAGEIKVEVEKFLASAQIGPNSYLKIYLSAQSKIRCEIKSFDLESNPLVLGLAPMPYSHSGEIPKFQNRSNYNLAFSIAQDLTDLQIDDALLIINGYIPETTRANIFLKAGDKILSPNEDVGLIRGIAHESVFSYLEKKHIPVIARKITIQDIIQAEEMITTNSVRGVQRVRKITSSLLKEEKIFSSSQKWLYEIAQVSLAKSNY